MILIGRTKKQPIPKQKQSNLLELLSYKGKRLIWLANRLLMILYSNIVLEDNDCNIFSKKTLSN